MAAKRGRITILRTDNQYVPDSLGARFMPPGVNFRAKVIGKVKIDGLWDESSCSTELLRLKAEVEQQRMMNKQFHKKRVILNVSLEGVAITDPMTAEISAVHVVNQIARVQQDPVDNRTLCYVYGNGEEGYTIYAFKTERPADHFKCTLRDLFQIIFNMKKRNQTPNAVTQNTPAPQAQASGGSQQPTAQQTSELVTLQQNIEQITATANALNLELPAESPGQQPTVAQQPLAQPVLQQPVAQQPMVQQPVAQQPMVQQPVAQQPMVQQPMVQPVQQQQVFQQQTPVPQQTLMQQTPAAQQQGGDPFGGSFTDPWAAQPQPQQPAQPPGLMDQISGGGSLLTPHVLGGAQQAEQTIDPFAQLVNRPVQAGMPTSSAKQLFKDQNKKDSKSILQLQQEQHGLAKSEPERKISTGNKLEALMNVIPGGKKPQSPTGPASSGLGLPSSNDPLKTKTLEKIASMIEDFLGVGDSNLAEAIYDLGYIRDDPSEFAEQISSSDLNEFGFTETFIFDLWGAMEDVRAGRMKAK